MQVAIALFPRMTALDAVGPYEVLQRVPSIDVVFRFQPGFSYSLPSRCSSSKPAAIRGANAV